MSCPEWHCPNCKNTTFGFPDGVKWEKKCETCGKLLTNYMYDEEFQERCDRQDAELEEEHDGDLIY